MSRIIKLIRYWQQNRLIKKFYNLWNSRNYRIIFFLETSFSSSPPFHFDVPRSTRALVLLNQSANGRIEFAETERCTCRKEWPLAKTERGRKPDGGREREWERDRDDRVRSRILFWLLKWRNSGPISQATRAIFAKTVCPRAIQT